MTNSIPDDIQESIERHIAGGRYSSVDEVLRDAMAKLDDVEETRRDLKRSLEDEQAGRLRPFREFDKEFCDKHDLEALE